MKSNDKSTVKATYLYFNSKELHVNLSQSIDTRMFNHTFESDNIEYTLKSELSRMRKQRFWSFKADWYFITLLYLSRISFYSRIPDWFKINHTYFRFYELHLY